MKAIKIDNPLWVGQLGPYFKKYLDIIKVDGITYESFYTHLCQVAQLGGAVSELWVVFDEGNIPMAFAQWQIKGLPYIGSVGIEHIYNWSKKNAPVRILLDEYEKFAESKHAPILYGGAVNTRLYEYWEKQAKKREYKFKREPFITFAMGKRLQGE